ncbi:hypothetical protein HDV02_005654 [Globomyces sp. JEL0801]|nr:hypothetical protein HDV02_005654 [Globomyces sp. JEL0801]
MMVEFLYVLSNNSIDQIELKSCFGTLLQTVAELISKCQSNKNLIYHEIKLLQWFVKILPELQDMDSQLQVVAVLFRLTPINQTAKQEFFSKIGLDPTFDTIGSTYFQRDARLWLTKANQSKSQSESFIDSTQVVGGGPRIPLSLSVNSLQLDCQMIDPQACIFIDCNLLSIVIPDYNLNLNSTISNIFPINLPYGHIECWGHRHDDNTILVTLQLQSQNSQISMIKFHLESSPFGINLYHSQIAILKRILEYNEVMHIEEKVSSVSLQLAIEPSEATQDANEVSYRFRNEDWNQFLDLDAIAPIQLNGSQSHINLPYQFSDSLQISQSSFVRHASDNSLPPAGQQKPMKVSPLIGKSTTQPEKNFKQLASGVVTHAEVNGKIFQSDVGISGIDESERHIVSPPVDIVLDSQSSLQSSEYKDTSFINKEDSDKENKDPAIPIHPRKTFKHEDLQSPPHSPIVSHHQPANNNQTNKKGKGKSRKSDVVEPMESKRRRISKVLFHHDIGSESLFSTSSEDFSEPIRSKRRLNVGKQIKSVKISSRNQNQSRSKAMIENDTSDKKIQVESTASSTNMKVSLERLPKVLSKSKDQLQKKPTERHGLPMKAVFPSYNTNISATKKLDGTPEPKQPQIDTIRLRPLSEIVKQRSNSFKDLLQFSNKSSLLKTLRLDSNSEKNALKNPIRPHKQIKEGISKNDGLPDESIPISTPTRVTTHQVILPKPHRNTPLSSTKVNLQSPHKVEHSKLRRHWTKQVNLDKITKEFDIMYKSFVNRTLNSIDEEISKVEREGEVIQHAKHAVQMYIDRTSQFQLALKEVELGM